MAEHKKLNVEIAKHAGHTLRVWHDHQTRWFYDIDGTNPQPVRFDFETGFDVEKEGAKAKERAHQAVHQGQVCQEPPNWILDVNTKAEVLGRKDKGLR